MKKIRIQKAEVDGVHVLRGRVSVLGKTLTFCSYVIEGMMIDTGPTCAREQIMQFARECQVEKIVLTHFHEDHSGNAQILKQELGIPIYMTAKTQSLLETLKMPFYRRVTWGELVGESIPGEFFNEGDWLETPRYRFRVVATPGHSEDHICLVNDEKGWIFAGDLFLSTKLYVGLRGESVQQLIQSIRKVLSTSIETIFCGHAGVVPHARKAFEQKLHYLEWLTEETYKLAEQGRDRKEITRQLLPRQPLIQWVSQGEMSPSHLIDSILREKISV